MPEKANHTQGETGKGSDQNYAYLKDMSMDDLYHELEKIFDAVTVTDLDLGEISAILSAMDEKEPLDYDYDPEVLLKVFQEKYDALFNEALEELRRGKARRFVCQKPQSG